MANWHERTDYHTCACCGQPLAGFVQETIPGKRRVFVTCETPECETFGKTLAVHEHVSLCYALNQKTVKSY